VVGAVLSNWQASDSLPRRTRCSSPAPTTRSCSRHWSTRSPIRRSRHEAAYQARVAAAGETANLLQRSQNAFGHCDFGVQDVMTNFNDLVGWVSTGVRPW